MTAIEELWQENKQDERAKLVQDELRKMTPFICTKCGRKSPEPPCPHCCEACDA